MAKGTGETFSWHRENIKESLGRKSQRSQRSELEIFVIREGHARGYFCTADNNHDLIQTKTVNITVKSK